MMYPDDESTGIMPLRISNNCLKKLQIDWSFCNLTRMFIFNLSVLTYFHKMDEFKHALSSSASVDRGITGSVCRKSPANKIIAPPNRFWFFVNFAMCDLMLPKIFCVPSRTHPQLLIYSAATLWPS
uniref:Uncharacterized protein n=1 Tax=Sipha flava TaxID=143950 RepID=A0A2S2QYA4_9HEMI